MAAQYPTAAGTDANLFIASNNLSTVLNGAINNAVTTITVATTTGFPTAGYITIDAEAISYTGTTGTTFTGCTRGADGTAAASHLDTTLVYHNVVAAHHNVLKDEIKAVEGDLVAINSALTPTSATSTSTSLLNRINMIVNQIKALSGQTNWYDSIAKNITQYLALSGGTMSGAIAMGTSKITGIGSATAATDVPAYSQVGALQTVSATTTSVFTTTSATFVATNLTATITPKFSTSKVRIEVSGIGQGGSGGTMQYTITRGGSNLGGTGGFGRVATSAEYPIAMVYLDSPATTSATSYDVRIFQNTSGTAQWGETNCTQSIILTEIQ